MKQKLFFYCSFLFVLFLSSFQVISICALIILVLISITDQPIGRLKTIATDKQLLLFVGFYLLHAVSLIYTSNKDYGLFDLQVKLSFLIMPFVFSTIKFTEFQNQRILLGFISGCVIVTLGNAVVSISRYFKTNDLNQFFYVNFSTLMHPSYYALYLNLAVIAALYLINKHGSNLMLIVMTAINCAAIVILSSRTSTVVFIFSVVVYFVMQFYSKKLNKITIGLFISIIVIAIVTLIFSLKKYNRYAQVGDVVLSEIHPKSISEPKEENSTTVRMHLWPYALQLISMHPIIGVGVGDIKEELVNVYKQNNYQYGIENRFSPHNQYLHTAVILGGLGLLLLLSLLLYPMYNAIKVHQFIMVIFLIIICLNIITESMLERQAGILFFCFFSMFFYTQFVKSPSLNE